MTAVPEQVTCPACREYARGGHLRQADTADALARYIEAAELTARPGVTASGVRAHAQAPRHRAGRFAQVPGRQQATS